MQAANKNDDTDLCKRESAGGLPHDAIQIFMGWTEINESTVLEIHFYASKAGGKLGFYIITKIFSEGELFWKTVDKSCHVCYEERHMQLWKESGLSPNAEYNVEPLQYERGEYVEGRSRLCGEDGTLNLEGMNSIFVRA